jgi:LacI family transcriptional regulator
MPRPTIKDLAQAANVSISTVNRILHDPKSVRQNTRELVLEAAERISFYAVGSIQSQVSAAKKKFRLGFILQQPHRTYYQLIGAALKDAADAYPDANLSVQVEYLEHLTPQNISDKMRQVGLTCDAIGVVSAVHPLVSEAVTELQAQGKPVFGLISQLSATGQDNYVGLDNWKVGRNAAWFMDHACKRPGKIAILVGNHRYRCQDMNESGFRSYFREYAPGFTILDPLSTFESSEVAQDLTEKLLHDVPDLAGIFVAGGGITGVITALRQNSEPGRVVLIGHQLLDVTRQALLDGYMTLAITSPLDLFVQTTVSNMVNALAKPDLGSQTAIIPFELHIRENI